MEGDRPEHERRLALRLVASGLAFAGVAVAFIAATGLHASVGPVSLLGLAALVGLLTVVAGGVVAVVAIVGRGERSALVFATVPVSVLALLVVLAEIIFDVP